MSTEEVEPMRRPAGDPMMHGAAGAALPSQALVVADIRARLSASVVGRPIYLMGELPSTGTLTRRLAQQGAPEGTTVIADAETAGQGRLGRPWFSPPGVNLHVSVLLRPNFHAREAGRFSLIAPLAVAFAVEDLGLSPAVKWPNDVLVGGKRVAATRVETMALGEHVSAVMLSAMVNINVDPGALSAALGPAENVTSLSAVLGERLDRSAFAAAYLSRLDAWVRRYRAEGVDPVLAAWRERDALIGRCIHARGPRGEVKGRAIRINSRGQLVLQAAGYGGVLLGDETLVVETECEAHGP